MTRAHSDQPTAPPGQWVNEPTIRSWYRSRSLRNQLTADIYVRNLGILLAGMQLTPRELLRIAREDSVVLRNRLVEYAEFMLKLPVGTSGRGHQASYLRHLFTSAASYLKFHDIEFHRFPELRCYQAATLINEEVPSPSQLQGVAEMLPLKGKVILHFLAQSGVRPGVIGGYQARKGLTLADLPDLDIPSLSFRQFPFLIRVREDVSKNGRSYFSFGGEECGACLVEYLSSRRARGEALTPYSPVLARHQRRPGTPPVPDFLTTKSVAFSVRRALHAACPPNIRWRPYVLRAYFSTRLMLAESEGRIQRDTREFLMGHDLGVSGRYNMGKRLPEAIVEMARREYARSTHFLSFNESPPVKSPTVSLDWLLESAGVPEPVRKSIDWNKVPERDLARVTLELLSTRKTEGASRLPTPWLKEPRS